MTPPPCSRTKGPDSPGRVPNFDPDRWQSTTDDRFNSSRKHGAFWKKDPSSFITLSHFRSSNWTSWCNSRTCDILGICATAMTVLPASKCSISCEKPDRFTPISIQGILIKSSSSWSKKQHLSNKSTDSNSDSSRVIMIHHPSISYTSPFHDTLTRTSLSNQFEKILQALLTRSPKLCWTMPHDSHSNICFIWGFGPSRYNSMLLLPDGNVQLNLVRMSHSNGCEDWRRAFAGTILLLKSAILWYSTQKNRHMKITNS